MSGKTKITKSLLKILNFDVIGNIAIGVYVNAKTKMVIDFSTNIPVISRYISRDNYAYVGGYEYYEDALEEFNKVVIPQQIPDDKIDLKSLRETCQDIIDEIIKDGYWNEDNDSYLAEESMKAIFGKDIYDNIRKYTD